MDCRIFNRRRLPPSNPNSPRCPFFRQTTLREADQTAPLHPWHTFCSGFSRPAVSTSSYVPGESRIVDSAPGRGAHGAHRIHIERPPDNAPSKSLGPDVQPERAAIAPIPSARGRPPCTRDLSFRVLPSRSPQNGAALMTGHRGPVGEGRPFHPQDPSRSTPIRIRPMRADRTDES